MHTGLQVNLVFLTLAWLIYFVKVSCTINESNYNFQDVFGVAGKNVSSCMDDHEWLEYISYSHPSILVLFELLKQRNVFSFLKAGKVYGFIY